MNRRVVVPASVAALACVAASGLGAASADAATSWSATATQSVPMGSGVTGNGALAAATPMTVHVALALRNQPTLKQDIASGKVLSVAAFKSQFAPTAAQVSAVQTYLTSQGLTLSGVTPNNVLVSATGSASAVEQAFHTALENVTSKGATGFANTTAASVPASLSSTVVSVLGLNNVFHMTAPDLQTKPAVNQPSTCTIQGVVCSYNPQGYQAAYDATGTPTGSATTEAIFTEGDVSGVVNDLRTEETANGLPEVPVTVDDTGPASTDTSGADEFDLDTQYSTGMAQDVKSLILYNAPSLDDSDLAMAFSAFASQDTAKAGSASFGGCEFESELDGSLTADDELFEEAAAQGQTVFASAGDTGGFCSVGTPNGVPAGAPDVEYPASSPSVVGVGGTTLLTNSDGSYDTELAWVAGGGGPSLFEPAPSWQAGDGIVGTLAGLVGRRTLPDVAMAADPNTGANVYVDGTPETVGGTSLASPLALGVWDRLESAHANGLGFASPLLYGAQGTAAFHDVELGDTGPYPATPGYDLATGLGTFDVAQADTLIK
jgi:pseudomonalisin